MMPLINTLQGKPDAFPPIWLLRQAGRYLPEYQAIRQKVPNFMDLCFHEDYATEVTLQPIRRFDFDAAILFSDILVIPHVLGQTVQIIERLGPVLTPIESHTFFEKAKEIDLLHALKVPLKVIENIRQNLPQEKAVIGFSGSPWTIATYMLEQGKSKNFEKIKNLLKTKDSSFVNTMSLLEESIGTFLIAQIKAGADVVQIFDSWASAVPVDEQTQWIVSPIRNIINRIQAIYPQTPIIYYGRGVSNLYSRIAEGLTNIAFGVDENVSISVMKDQIQKLSPIQGNLSPQVLVEGGEAMKTNVNALLKAFQGTPYVFNLGHGIVPQTPIDHVRQLVELVRKRDIVND